MKRKLSFLAVILSAVMSASAQTSTFTYQGHLTDSGGQAASYDFTVHLCATAAANCIIGDGSLAFQFANALPVGSNGTFTIPISFSSSLFDGSARYLRILVRRASQGSYVELTPRQEIVSTPYAIQSLKATSATTAGNVTGIVGITNGGTGSATQNFVDLTTAQSGIAGNKTFTGTVSANAVNATTQYNIFGNRILGNPGTNNIFVGIGAGTVNTTGNGNSFVGRSAGASNTAGAGNTFVGSEAGLLSTTGSSNSFIGSSAGRVSTGADNSFIGANAGLSNTNGANNSFVGSLAGANNTSGARNIFIGESAGLNNLSGSDNIYIGRLASNASSSTQLNNSMAIGNDVTVTASNTIALGRHTQTTVIRGILKVVGGVDNPEGDSPAFESVFTTRYGYGIGIRKLYLASIADPVFTTSPICLQFVGLEIPYGHAGYCANGTLASRFKNDVAPFAGGIETIRRLRPVSFKWKENNDPAIGLNAEDVAAIDERFINRDEKGEIRDVKETALTVLLINAVTQQQEQIERMQKKIELLEKLACDGLPAPPACKP